ncbi:hypothetical protein PIB30_003221 [Stylosanthes scabra]|uniref:Uncharacterized protein n=1 Tax=Stylosanthes scabra TaxID=79078 RepID=A0ABU6Q371_9FABA|nr:hypothetical protein [Stylosanthes scabra]
MKNASFSYLKRETYNVHRAVTSVDLSGPVAFLAVRAVSMCNHTRTTVMLISNPVLPSEFWPYKTPLPCIARAPNSTNRPGITSHKNIEQSIFTNKWENGVVCFCAVRGCI